jgi:dGTPase
MALVTEAALPRQRTEDLERASLSTWATLAAESKGRDRFEDADPLRTVFQQDRDRILASEAFRRLPYKTHRFLMAGGATRDRLSHALQVAQLARTMARALRLNEDLAEAVALGHDVGHGPFGGAADEALEILEGGFRHPEQSVRVVEALEAGGWGLNLSWEVRDGILHHPWSDAPPLTAEARLVRLAHRISGVVHDLRAGVRAGVVEPRDIPREITAALGPTHESRMATLAGDVVTTSMDQPEVGQSAWMHEATGALEEFVSRHILGRAEVRAERDRAVHCLRSLAIFFMENPEQLPAEHRTAAPVSTRVKDFLAACTDRQALEEFSRRFAPGVS